MTDNLQIRNVNVNSGPKLSHPKQLLPNSDIVWIRFWSIWGRRGGWYCEQLEDQTSCCYIFSLALPYTCNYRWTIPIHNIKSVGISCFINLYIWNLAYLLCGWFSEGFIGSFVAIILLLSLDFWTVKNITGRIMAGLRWGQQPSKHGLDIPRWWNYVNDEGSSVWVFEKGGDEVDMRLSKAEVQIFWTGLVVSPVIWVSLVSKPGLRISFDDISLG